MTNFDLLLWYSIGSNLSVRTLHIFCASYEGTFILTFCFVELVDFVSPTASAYILLSSFLALSVASFVTTGKLVSYENTIFSFSS